ncbi:MAG: YnbE family lipoprotein, partial [Pseudomonadales bacterium]
MISFGAKESPVNDNKFGTPDGEGGYSAWVHPLHDRIGSMMKKRIVLPSLAIVLGGALAGCQPTVKIEAPDKPIEINLNVKIEQEIRV